MKPIVVLDSNIYISSTFWDGGPYIIAKKAIKQDIIVFISSHIIGEVRNVLRRDFNLPMQEIDDIVDSFVYFTHMIEPKEKFDIIKEDPPDNRILECAVASKATFIISYNKHLLVMKDFRGIKIVTPKQFLDLINKN